MRYVAMATDRTGPFDQADDIPLLNELDIIMAIFLNIPGIAGDSLDRNHRGWIDIDELSHSITVADTPGSGGRRSGKSTATDFAITKRVDLASVKLQQALLTGENLKSATINLTRPTSNGEAVYLSYELENCTIRSWDIQALESGVAAEQLLLDFTTITTTFTPTSAGGRSGSDVDFAWDFAKGARA